MDAISEQPIWMKVVLGLIVAAVAVYIGYLVKAAIANRDGGDSAKYNMRAGAPNGNGMQPLGRSAPCNTDPARVPMIMMSDRGGSTNTQVDPSLHLRQDRTLRSQRALDIHDPMKPGDLKDILPTCETDTLLTGGKDPRLPSSYMADTMIAVLPRTKLHHDPFLGNVMVEAPRVGLMQTRYRLSHLRPGLFSENGDKVAAITNKMAQGTGQARSIFEAYGV